MTTMNAPRRLSSVLFILASLLAVWAVFLFFFNPKYDPTYATKTSLRIAGLGVVIAIVLALAGSIAATWSRRNVEIPAIVGATLLAVLTLTYLSGESLRANSAWAAFDLGEVLALAGAAWSLSRGRSRLTVLSGTVGAALFVADAWFNVVLQTSGSVVSVLVFGLIGELTVAALCVQAVHIALHHMPPGTRPNR